ncbi:MAG: glycogen debranching enzyme N-terminal domain-containing protein [Desulfamplus sp.]|nr:glycogen debranching enzyme N-terminal domain-containing protein [Desulfamplus sp.]
MITQYPEPGSFMVMFCGDCITFTLELCEKVPEDMDGMGEGSRNAAGDEIRNAAGDEIRYGNGAEISGEAFIRTDLARAATLRREIIREVELGDIPPGEAWHDIKMTRVSPSRFSITLPLFEPGHFQAKCFFLPRGSTDLGETDLGETDQGKNDGQIGQPRENYPCIPGTPMWPGGDNCIINVDSAGSCCANIVYNAFVRQFGESRCNDSIVPQKSMEAGDQSMEAPDRSMGAPDQSMGAPDQSMEAANQSMHHLDSLNYTVIPPSGKFRDLIHCLDFIFYHLGCRMLQLLPIHPTPTTYGRMGRFGSPYAALDFRDVDPALAVFDPMATPLEQFMELADAVHARRGYLVLDIAINHTGWASTLHGSHPEWLVRDENGTIEVPGAWGVKWEDLTRIDYSNKEVWQYMADIFLLWCRRRVDGFRCDAAYMIPLPAWKYIVARVRHEYPDTIFLLEGLGGSISATCDLLNKANMNWAYSELFQNYDRHQIEDYLPRAVEISQKYGLMLHFAETHDNPRLAGVSRVYAMMRTALCALSSMSGAFGFTAGVEWFATEKIDVHGSPSLNWGAAVNQVPQIRRLNLILKNHAAFRHNTALEFIHQNEPPDSSCIALLRLHRPSGRKLLVLVNLDCESPARVFWPSNRFDPRDGCFFDLLHGLYGDNFPCSHAGDDQKNYPPYGKECPDCPHAGDDQAGNAQVGDYREQRVIPLVHGNGELLSLGLMPGQVCAISPHMEDLDILNADDSSWASGFSVRQKLRAAALEALALFHGPGDVGDMDIDGLAQALFDDPVRFCRQLNTHAGNRSHAGDMTDAGERADAKDRTKAGDRADAKDRTKAGDRADAGDRINAGDRCYNSESRVIQWRWDRDHTRCVMVPPGFFLLVTAQDRFRAEIKYSPYEHGPEYIPEYDRKYAPEYGGQYFPESGGQYIPESGGQYIPESGGQYFPESGGKYGEDKRAFTLACKEALPMADGGFFTLFPPGTKPGAKRVTMEMTLFQGAGIREVRAHLLYLAPHESLAVKTRWSRRDILKCPSLKFLGTNRRGAMMRASAHWGAIESRYDAFLAANLHPDYPEDRWILLSRYRIWVICRGYSRELAPDCLGSFALSGKNRALWCFHVPTCQGSHVHMEISLEMVEGENRVLMTIHRRNHGNREVSHGNRELGNENREVGHENREMSHANMAVQVVIRPDIEYRSFHDTVKAWAGPEEKWMDGVTPMERDTSLDGAKQCGFLFNPQGENGHALGVTISRGEFTLESQWRYMVHRPLEESRGLDPHSDLFSPGFFSVNLTGGQSVIVTAEASSGAKVFHYLDESSSGRPIFHQDHVETLGHVETQGHMETRGHIETLGHMETGSRSEANKCHIRYVETRGHMETQGHTPLQDKSSRISFAGALLNSLDAFVVERGGDKSVIAGYPWFLDWGRDSLIFTRALIQAGRYEDAKAVLRLFGRFEHKGTLPNMIRGRDAGNRETSDAPLWFFTACREITLAQGDDFLQETMGRDSLGNLLVSMAESMVEGTPTGVIMDPETALLYSPSHFTWMDTNHPPGTPREGYPVDIQALWFHALDFLGTIDSKNQERWRELADKAKHYIIKLFFRKEEGYFSDCLHVEGSYPVDGRGHANGTGSINGTDHVPRRGHANGTGNINGTDHVPRRGHANGQGALHGDADDALRPNQLLLVTLGLLDDHGEMAISTLESCMELLVPGAIRSLSNRPLTRPLNIHHKGELLKDPFNPYSGTYQGDEDTKRKPAYHNGTAWTWPFPLFCEAWVRIFGPKSTRTALAWLGSGLELMETGAAGYIPEILDGDYPHTPRGCDAQAWGSSEFLRVWLKLVNYPYGTS